VCRRALASLKIMANLYPLFSGKSRTDPKPSDAP
jgi:hypothetical protein